MPSKFGAEEGHLQENWRESLISGYDPMLHQILGKERPFMVRTADGWQDHGKDPFKEMAESSCTVRVLIDMPKTILKNPFGQQAWEDQRPDR